MLSANKHALSRELRLNMLQIQWKELEYLHQNFQNLATTSAVLVGFGVLSWEMSQEWKPHDFEDATQITRQPVWDMPPELLSDWYMWTQVFAEAFFYGFAALAIAFNLLALFISTLSTMCGPGMALRGPEGAVGHAVRHLEAQLRRALLYFGRGIVAFTCSLITIGVRRLHTIGAFGGIISGIAGVYTLKNLWHYGSDIGEKFYVSPERTVRGTFVSTKGGQSRWRNTQREKEQIQVYSGWWFFGFQFGRRARRWRPDGHSTFTPLWRLDRLISFPYFDEFRVQEQLLTSDQMRQTNTVDSRAADEQACAHRLVMRAQEGLGQAQQQARPVSAYQPPLHPSRLPRHSQAQAQEPESEPHMFQTINPMHALQMVSQALTGGGQDSDKMGRSGRSEHL